MDSAFTQVVVPRLRPTCRHDVTPAITLYAVVCLPSLVAGQGPLLDLKDGVATVTHSCRFAGALASLEVSTGSRCVVFRGLMSTLNGLKP